MDAQRRGIIKRDWVVLFVPGPRRGWYDLFTHPEYRHVYAATHYPELNAWLIIDWSSSGFVCEHIAHAEAMLNFAKCKEAGYRALLVKAVYDRANRVTKLPRAPIYCVSFVKHLIGMKGLFPVTPFQLYRDLKRHGACPIF